MAQTNDKYLEIVGPLFQLPKAIETKLAKTGFRPSIDPPFEEPGLPIKLSSSTNDELHNLYDKLLCFYGYLSDQLTRQEPYMVTAKKAVEVVTALAFKEAIKQKDLKNADARKAYVETHEFVQKATREYIYFKQLHSAQEERRRKISKFIDRVYRELTLRQPRSTFTSRGPSQAQQRSNISRMFKPVTRE